MKSIRFSRTSLSIMPLTVLLFAAVQVSPLKPTLDALQSAKSFSAHFKVVRSSGESGDFSLFFGKGVKYKLDTPSIEAVSDGTNLTILDKNKNTYTVEPTNIDPLKDNSLMEWSGLFDSHAYKTALDISNDGSKTIAGKETSVVKVKFPEGVSGKFFLNPDTSVPLGEQILKGDTSTTVISKDAAISDTALPDDTFVFVAPDGAKKVDKPVTSVDYSKVDAIFQNSCTSCHGGANPKAGYDMTTYDGVMSGGNVTAGDPDNSDLYRYITGAHTPRMPLRSAPLSDADTKTIHDWILAGAKNQ